MKLVMSLFIPGYKKPGNRLYQCMFGKSVLWLFFVIFILFSSALGIFSLDDPTKETKISYPETVKLLSNKSTQIDVTLSIPSGNYIFLEHLSDEGAGILTSFGISKSEGLELEVIKKPEGKKLKHEVILSGKGVFTLRITDTKGYSPGSRIKGELQIQTQLCNKAKGLCFIPYTFKKEILFMVFGSAWTADEYNNHTYKTFTKYGPANERIDFDNIDYPLLHAAIFYETNRQRAKNSKKVFLHSPALEKAAKGHSDDMVKYAFFDHSSPVKGKETMTKRLALAGIDTGYRGENIAYSFGIEYESGKSVYTPDQNGGYFSYKYKGKPIENHTYLGFAKVVLDQWMNSPGHRANILDPDFSYLGTGAAHYRDTGFYDMDNFKCTQNFGSTKGPED